MNKGFTLLELMVVVGIMGLLGTVSVGAYQQMQRGMEERGVKENANRFIDMVFQRSRIDRKPTAVYYWNERVRDETDDDNAIFVGKAVAIRSRGRVSGKKGSVIFDEFGDLEQYDESGAFKEFDSSEPQVRLYKFENGNDVKVYSAQAWMEREKIDSAEFMTADPEGDRTGVTEKRTMYLFGYKVSGGSWNVGDLYGMEFQTFQLPHGYIFGSNLPSTRGGDTMTAGKCLFFSPYGDSSGTIQLYAMRPGSSGNLSPVSIGTTDKPKIEN